MDKLADAKVHLNPELITDISIDFPRDAPSDEEDLCKNTRPTSSNYPSPNP